MNVLVVDDDPLNRKMLRTIFEHHGCSVLEAQNGKEGFDMAITELPDIIVSDALMPVMDGYQFLKAVRTDNRLDGCAFIFYTAVYTGDKEAEFALLLGADAFLTKPHDLNELWTRIQEVISSRRKSRRRPNMQNDMLSASGFLERYSSIVSSKLEEKIHDLEREITERRAAEEIVKRQHEELRILSARIAEAEEQERRRIARELHDQVGQNLSALSINLAFIRNMMPKKGMEDVHSRIDDSIALLQQTTEILRTVMADLRPPLLDEYGLAAALEWYAREFSERTGIKVDVQPSGTAVRLSTSREAAMFWIAREAVTNAAKHSNAANITIHLEMTEQMFSMVIEDNGVGFDPLVLFEHKERAGWGLLNMKERAAMVGGECRIESARGKGTVVSVEVAL